MKLIISKQRGEPSDRSDSPGACSMMAFINNNETKLLALEFEDSLRRLVETLPSGDGTASKH